MFIGRVATKVAEAISFLIQEDRAGKLYIRMAEKKDSNDDRRP